MKRKALAVAGVAALATFSIAGAALAAGADDPVRPGTSVSGSPSPDDNPDPTDTASPDDSPTGSLTDSPTASPDDSSTTTAPAVPSDLAAAAALSKVGGGVVTRIESEVEHGRAVWKIRIVKDGVRYDVRVDKQTGEIVRFESKGADSGGSGNSGSGSGRGGHDDPPGDDHGGGGHGSDD
jgi:hypothetical protein